MLYLDGGQLAMKRAMVTGANVLGSFLLGDLDAGTYIGFEVRGQGTLIGAYGAWGKDGNLSTHLERFTIEVEPR